MTSLFLLSLCWQLLINQGYGNWTAAPCDTPVNSDLATFSFPVVTAQTYPAFLVSTDTVRGNLSGGILVCTFTLDTAPGTSFRYGGQNSWNWGPLPPNTRLFFSSQVGYGQSQYSVCPKCFYFSSQAWHSLDDQTGTVTLAAPLAPTYWSDAGGCPGPCSGSFNSTVSNVKQVGLAFGGGDFYDVGLAMWAGGSNRFHLVDFRVYYPRTLPVNPKEATLAY